MNPVFSSLLLLLPSAMPAAFHAQDEGATDAQPQSRPADPYEQEANRRTDAANVLLEEGAVEEALGQLRALVKEHEVRLGRDHVVTAQGYNNLSHALAVQGDYGGALEAGHTALEILQNIGSEGPEIALVKRSLADVCERKGELREAQVWIEDCWRLLEGGFGKTPMVADARATAARIALQLGQLDVAQEHLEWAFAIQERLLPADDPTAARTLIPLATVLARRGQFDVAQVLYAHARRRLEHASTPSDEDWSIAFDSELAVANRLGRKREARELLEDLLERRPAVVEPTPETVEIELQIAAGLLEAGASERARDRLEGLRVHLTVGAEEEPFTLVRALLPLARAQLELGEHEAALAAIEEALQRMESGPGLENEVAVELLILRGQTRMHMGDLEAAKVDLHAVLDIRREQLGEKHPALLDVFLGLIECELGAKGVTVGLVDLLEMVEGPLRHLTPARLTDRIHAERQAYARPYDAALVQGNYALAQAKSSSLATTFQAIDRQRERALLASLGWWLESGQLEADDRLASLVANLDLREGQVFEKAVEITLDDQTTQLRQELRENGLALSRAAFPAGAELEAARAYFGDACLLQYSWAGSELWGICLGRSIEEDRVVRIGSTAELSPLLARAQQDLRRLDRPCDMSNLARLLLLPFGEQLANCREVVVVADGPLAFLPFEALPFGGPESVGSPWAASTRVSYAPSVAALMELETAQAAGDAVVHFGPAYIPGAPQAGRVDAQFERDPGDGPAPTIGEVLPEGEAQIAGTQARESVLKAKSAAGEFEGVRLLDLRVKTYVDASVPSATGFRLASETDDQELPLWRREDGFVNLGEIAGLQLGGALVHLPLVEVGPDSSSADLRSEGLHGLVRALGAAGAKGVIVASWTTPDNAARLFDRRVLEQAGGAAPRTALWNAQRSWIRDAQARGADGADLLHPGVWARLRYFGR